MNFNERLIRKRSKPKQDTLAELGKEALKLFDRIQSTRSGQLEQAEQLIDRVRPFGSRDHTDPEISFQRKSIYHVIFSVVAASEIYARLDEKIKSALANATRFRSVRSPSSNRQVMRTVALAMGASPADVETINGFSFRGKLTARLAHPVFAQMSSIVEATQVQQALKGAELAFKRVSQNLSAPKEEKVRPVLSDPSARRTMNGAAHGEKASAIEYILVSKEDCFRHLNSLFPKENIAHANGLSGHIQQWSALRDYVEWKLFRSDESVVIMTRGDDVAISQTVPHKRGVVFSDLATGKQSLVLHEEISGAESPNRRTFSKSAIRADGSILKIQENGEEKVEKLALAPYPLFNLTIGHMPKNWTPYVPDLPARESWKKSPAQPSPEAAQPS